MMHRIKNIMRILYDKNKFFGSLYTKASGIKAVLLSKLDDETYIKIKYKASTGQQLDLDNPQSFNEKIQWLKLYYHLPLYTQLVDKYSVRDYVKEKIGDKYLTRCYGVFLRFEDINFDKLPDRFVIKCTHDCGSVVLCDCKSKINKDKIRKKLSAALTRNYFYQGREWAYKNVIPRIIIEEYLDDHSTKDLYDYKFFCFNGIPKVLLVASGRNSNNLRMDFYDMDFQKLPFERGHHNSNLSMKKPEGFKKMIELAAKLSKDIPFVRVDFYDIEGRIVFGEMTLYPAGGMGVFKPKEWDYILGDWLVLPNNKVL